ncbi:amidohydrolase family protein [Verminephrobacter eiseniae]|uniref:amidohydrolase family protein n=1 Tax=Verminephrobacter eiseniae TaxID=364317 RepID=UPI0010EC1AC3|nr:amidohydrolase family protein [Verminephrobacter eiseniae]KAB7619323.1 amidohydrolase family protein [Verminephrobacter sp. Larva24]MCW5230073.1 amidohydrolase [Verminephrobacter eiseniae]MCW5291805.1 amidohydrolase [Verminephrobacter eiseniae]MCW8185626.1 amidohydrolase [Verminephrobacter eiseniae]MCW8224249.1 amidohydrolase [Verminephrobacter eiseniae]
MRPWIDTHLHLLYPQRLDYDWTKSLPVLDRVHVLEEYAGLAQPSGIRLALHMEADVRAQQMEAETDLIGQLARQPDSLIAGAISSCRPEHDEIGGFLERALSNPLIHGFRRVLHVVPDELSTSATFRRNVRALTGQGHPFDLCVLPGQFHLADALAKACPESQMVLDHCGVPAVASQALDPWKEGIARLAANPNMACKISGLIAYGDASRWPDGDVASVVRDLRPYFEHVVDRFGWGRLIWGSDYPVCNLTRDLPTWKTVTDQLVAGCSDSEIDALAYGNARRIYRLTDTC